MILISEFVSILKILFKKMKVMSIFLKSSRKFPIYPIMNFSGGKIYSVMNFLGKYFVPLNSLNVKLPSSD